MVFELLNPLAGAGRRTTIVRLFGGRPVPIRYEPGQVAGVRGAVTDVFSYHAEQAAGRYTGRGTVVVHRDAARVGGGAPGAAAVSARTLAAGALLPVFALCLGCALTYDVEQQESEIARHELDARIDDLAVSLDPDTDASWVLQAHFYRVADYEVHKRVDRELRFGVQGGITEEILKGGSGASSGAVVHPVWLLPFTALFDLTTFFLSAPPVWLAGIFSSGDGSASTAKRPARGSPASASCWGRPTTPSPTWRLPSTTGGAPT